MTKIAISGACGRMGGRLVSLVHEDPELQLAAALECDGHPALGKDVGEVHQLGALGVTVCANLEAEASVLIDFSSPAGATTRAKECAEKQVGMVIGTTGLDDSQKACVDEAAKSVPVLMSPNMSMGVNLLFKLVEDVARVLGPDWDPEIVEIHHRFKKDSPSGTALRLAEHVAKGRGVSLDEAGVYGRHGIVGERKPGEIAVHAVRAGDVVGEHTITFGTLGERIELKHIAHTRDTFARGALVAAKFVATASPGLYSYSDLLTF